MTPSCRECSVLQANAPNYTWFYSTTTNCIPVFGHVVSSYRFVNICSCWVTRRDQTLSPSPPLGRCLSQLRLSLATWFNYHEEQFWGVQDWLNNPTLWGSCCPCSRYTTLSHQIIGQAQDLNTVVQIKILPPCELLDPLHRTLSVCLTSTSSNMHILLPFRAWLCKKNLWLWDSRTCFPSI